MSQPWGVNGYANADVVGTPSASPSQSGVYDSIATRQTLPSFWREDRDDENTSAYGGERVERTTALPVQPLQPRRKLWQVALQLRGDELSRLWRRNSSHLAGRVFVWSDYSSQWVRLSTSPEFAQVQFGEPLPIPSEQPRYPIVEPAQKPAALVRMQDIVDLTSLARPYLGHFPIRWAIGLAASLVTLVGLAALLPRKTASVEHSTPKHVATQPESREAGVPSVPKPEPIPVSTLPLISGARESKVALNSTAETAHPAIVNTRRDSGSAAGAFNASAARQVLVRAASQAHHCASGELSGSVLVTYEPSGAVGDVRVNALAGDLSRSECIVNAFRSARIAPFTGPRLVVRKSF